MTPTPARLKYFVMFYLIVRCRIKSSITLTFSFLFSYSLLFVTEVSREFRVHFVVTTTSLKSVIFNASRVVKKVIPQSLHLLFFPFLLCGRSIPRSHYTIYILYIFVIYNIMFSSIVFHSTIGDQEIESGRDKHVNSQLMYLVVFRCPETIHY